ncbi:hypothetical protein JCM9279_001095 [Rhodotorula babjevae]
MPPKASAKRASKRKADDERDQAPSASTSTPPVKEDSPLTDLEGEDADDEPQKKKRAKKEPVKPLDPSLPTNKTVPDVVEPFPRPAEGCIRISAWNVAGLRASDKKGFSRYVEAEDADVLIVTETKTPAIPLAALDDRYPHRYWGDHGAVKKGQAGTAIFSKIKPLNVTLGFTESDEVSAADSEGRMVTLEFENTFVVGTYVPNAGQALKNLADKERWNRAFETYLRSLDAKKPVVWAGDLNVVASGPIDIRNWKTNHNKSAGVTDVEIEGFRRQLNPDEGSGHARLVDVWRERHQDLEEDPQGWTYYSYKFQCREKGIGWRLDYQVVSERLLSKVKACEVRHTIWGASDHLPIVLDLEGPL